MYIPVQVSKIHNRCLHCNNSDSLCNECILLDKLIRCDRETPCSCKGMSALIAKETATEAALILGALC